MNLIGVDVGFSRRGQTTGIACLEGSRLHLSRAGTLWESRKAKIPANFQADVIAFDGPLLPSSANDSVCRRCERMFIRAPFWNRCKPGLSHFGFGLELRRAATTACDQFSIFLARSNQSGSKVFVSADGPVVEAFPNAFLAVLLSEEEFDSMPKLRRGHRFDWLYERAIESGRLESTLSGLELPEQVWQNLRTETDHEMRAALVCLLTAAFAKQGTAERVGDAEGGWFWLPPLQQWCKWAKEGLEKAMILGEYSPRKTRKPPGWRRKSRETTA